MTEVFRIDIEDTKGVTVASLKNFEFMSFETIIGRRGNLRLQLSDNDDNARRIGLDNIARIWYKNLAYGIDWLNIFDAIIKTPSRQWYNNGNKISTFYGSDSLELIDKSMIMYYPATPQAYKNDIATNVIGQYLEENIGSQARVSNGRFIDHINPITITYPPEPQGPVWEGDMSFDLLLKALQSVREFSQERNDRIDYTVNYLGGYKWEAKFGKLFMDRTINGLTSSGLNGVGNVPVVLSPRYNNVAQYSQSLQRVQEHNVVLALGQRVGADREYAIARDAASIAVSPIAHREILAQTQNQQTLTDMAESELQRQVAKENVVIEPKFSEAFVLFKDLNAGDFFTVIGLEGIPINKQLTELGVSVSQTEGGRTISQYSLFMEDREP